MSAGSDEPSSPAPPLPRLAGRWSTRIARAGGADLALVHGWMQAAHVEEFWHQAWPQERWQQEIAGHLESDVTLPVIVDLDGEPFAYVEVYRVARDRLADQYAHGSHDLGVHIAIGEVRRTGLGLGRALLRSVAEALLAADPSCDRVVAEPDVTNAPSVRAFEAAGFERVGVVSFPEKSAALMAHPRPVRGGESAGPGASSAPATSRAASPGVSRS